MTSGALPIDTRADDFVPSRCKEVLAGTLRLFTPRPVQSRLTIR
jgi:hypothetical protein